MDRYRNQNYRLDSREREQRNRTYYKQSINNHHRKDHNRPSRNDEPMYSPQLNKHYSPDREFHNERKTSPRGGKSHSRMGGESRTGQAGSARAEHIVTPPPSYSGLLDLNDLLSPEYNPENASTEKSRNQIGPNTSTLEAFRPVVDSEGDILMTDADSREAPILTELDLCLRDLEVAWKSAQKAKLLWRKNVLHRLRVLEDILETKYKYDNSGSEIPLEI